MKLYSTRDIQQIVQDALREKGFSIDRASHGIVEASQGTGRISQHFKIKVVNDDRDPI
ncbi:hypothetical protein [Bradyrhizobium hipponense]|uniref:hypothetical protein n=1 Tax=Bradyrhizobium hipponense TaxID=2605638 RepID=UPI001652F9D7|nr:hypothetical protein [Bradyrhizobium hipponense]